MDEGWLLHGPDPVGSLLVALLTLEDLTGYLVTATFTYIYFGLLHTFRLV